MDIFDVLGAISRLRKKIKSYSIVGDGGNGGNSGNGGYNDLKGKKYKYEAVAEAIIPARVGKQRE